MSRKHYRSLAAELSRIHYLFPIPEAYRTHCLIIADICASTNPHFNFSTFLDACGA